MSVILGYNLQMTRLAVTVIADAKPDVVVKKLRRVTT